MTRRIAVDLGRDTGEWDCMDCPACSGMKLFCSVYETDLPRIGGRLDICRKAEIREEVKP
jgi:hypothetical protein